MSAPVAFISARVIVTTMMTTIGVGVTVTITVVRIGTVITAATTTGISCLRYGRPTGRLSFMCKGDFHGHHYIADRYFAHPVFVWWWLLRPRSLVVATNRIAGFENPTVIACME